MYISSYLLRPSILPFQHYDTQFVSQLLIYTSYHHATNSVRSAWHSPCDIQRSPRNDTIRPRRVHAQHRRHHRRIHEGSLNLRRYRRCLWRRVWDGWHGDGKGRRAEERTDRMIQILRTTCLKCACRLFIPFSSSWYGRRRNPLLYDSAGRRHPTSCANARSISYLYIYSLLYRWHVRQHCGTSA